MDLLRTKKCRVCGDQAFAFNYNGLTCEPCKSFFRRHAFKYESLSCKRKDNCKIDLSNRNKCLKCRLKKCFDIGMKKELFKSIEAKGPKESVSQKNAIELVRTYEHNCLEVVKKVTLLFHEKPLGNINIIGYAPDMSRFFSNGRVFLGRLVQFAQHFEGFACLKPQDQIILIVSSLSELMMLRAAYFINFEKDAVIFHSLCMMDQQYDKAIYVKLDTLYGDKNCPLIPLHRNLSHWLRHLLGEDLFLVQLIIILIIFKAKNHQTTSDPELIKYHYKKYDYLLQKYLQTKYGANPNVVNEKYRKISLITGENQIGPLDEHIDKIGDHLNGRSRLIDAKTFYSIEALKRLFVPSDRVRFLLDSAG